MSQALVRLISSTQDSRKSWKDLGIAMDVSRARHIGLAQAAVILARAEGGSDTALRRLGIILPKVSTAVDTLKQRHDQAVAAGAKFTASQKLIYEQSLKNAAAQDKEATRQNIISELQRRFGGQTEAFARTAAGQYERLHETIRNVLEDIGGALLPGLTGAASGLQEWIAGLRESEAFHEGLRSAVSSISTVFHAAGAAISSAAPALKLFADSARRVSDVAGAGGILSLVVAYKAATVAITAASGALSFYSKAATSAIGAEGAVTTTTAEAAATEQAYTAAIEQNTLALGLNITALRQHALAQGLDVAAMDAEIASARASTVARTLSTEVGGAGVAASRSGRLFTALGTGIRSIISPTTAAAIGIAGISFGIYKLVTRETDWDRANKILNQSLMTLGDTIGTLGEQQRRLGDLRAEVPTLRAARDSAALAIERDKEALATSRAGRGTVEYKTLLNQLATDQAGLRSAAHQLAVALEDLNQTQARIGRLRDVREEQSQEAIRKTIALAREARSTIPTPASVTQNPNEAGRQEQLERRRRFALDRYVDKLREQADTEGKLAQKLRDTNPVKAAAAAQISRNIRLLGRFADSVDRLPNKHETEIILKLTGRKSLLELRAQLGDEAAQETLRETRRASAITTALDDTQEKVKISTAKTIHTAAEASSLIARHMAAYGKTTHDSVTSAAQEVSDAQNELAATITAGQQAVADSITQSKQNLNSLGQGLADAINSYLDKITGKTAEVDHKLTGATKREFDAIQAQLRAGHATPELEQRARALQSKLEQQSARDAAKGADGTDELQKRKDRIKRQFADLTDLYNKHAISRQQFEKRLTKILRDEGITRERIRKTEGVAAADAFTAALTGVREQAKAQRAAGAPQAPGTGLAAQIVRPLQALRDAEQNNLAARRRLSDAENSLRQAEIDEQKKLVAELANFRKALIAKGFTRSIVGGAPPPQGKTRGGPVHGPAGTDTVPALLTTGEIVLNQGQQQNLRGMLGVRGGGPHDLFEHVARGGRRRFADGGVVGDLLSVGRKLSGAYERLSPVAREAIPAFSWRNLSKLLTATTGFDPGVVRQRLHGNLATLGPGGRPLRPGEMVAGTAFGGPSARIIRMAEEAVALTPAEFAAHPRTFWHGTKYGRLLEQANVETSGQGFHVGTYEAARQALRAHMGRGDVGPREVGHARLEGARGGIRKWLGEPDSRGNVSHESFAFGRISGNVGIDRDFIVARDIRSDGAQAGQYDRGQGWAQEVLGSVARRWGYGLEFNGKRLKEPFVAGRPVEGALFPAWITGPMSNTPRTPHLDAAANSRMRSLLTRDQARRGYYYRNVSEDEGSISAVLPARSFIHTYEDFLGVAKRQKFATGGAVAPERYGPPTTGGTAWRTYVPPGGVPLGWVDVPHVTSRLEHRRPHEYVWHNDDNPRVPMRRNLRDWFTERTGGGAAPAMALATAEWWKDRWPAQLKFQTGGVAGDIHHDRPEPQQSFASLPMTEKRRRIEGAQRAGRITTQQARAASRYWGLTRAPARAPEVTDTSFRAVSDRLGFFPYGQAPVKVVPPQEEIPRLPPLTETLRTTIGPDLYDLVSTGRTDHPYLAALEAGAWVTGPVKLPGALAAGTRALLTRQGTRASLEALRAAHAAPLRYWNAIRTGGKGTNIFDRQTLRLLATERGGGAPLAARMRTLRPGVVALTESAREQARAMMPNIGPRVVEHAYATRSPGLYFPERQSLVLGRQGWDHSEIAEAMQSRFRLPPEWMFNPNRPHDNDWLLRILESAKQVELWDQGGFRGERYMSDIPAHWTLPGLVAETPEMVRLLQNYRNVSIIGSRGTIPPRGPVAAAARGAAAETLVRSFGEERYRVMPPDARGSFLEAEGFSAGVGSEHARDFFVGNVHVDSSLRRQGLGRSMYERAGREAARRGGHLYSSPMRTGPAAEMVWKALARDGLAHRAKVPGSETEGYVFGREAPRVRVPRERGDAASEIERQYRARGMTAAAAREAAVGERRERARIDRLVARRGTFDPKSFAATEWARQQGERARFLPPQVRSARDLEGLMGDLDEALREGLPYAKNWYWDSGHSLLSAAGGDLGLAEKEAALTAIFSPQMAVIPNIGLGLRATRELATRGRLSFGSEQAKEAARIAWEGGNWRSVYKNAPKVKAFFGNLLEAISPSLAKARGYSGDETTNDGWIGALFGYGNNRSLERGDVLNTTNVSFSEHAYDFITRATQQLAKHYNVRPLEAQAGLWVPAKARADESLAKRYAEGGASRRSTLREAGASFAEGIWKPEHTLRLAYEAVSDAKPFVAGLTSPQLFRYTAESGENLARTITEQLGIPARVAEQGYGAWVTPTGELEINPAGAIEIAIGSRERPYKLVEEAKPSPGGRVRKKEHLGGAARVRLPRDERDFAEAISSTAAHVFKQFGVGYLRPIEGLADADATAFHIGLGRRMSEDEIRAVSKGIDNRMLYLSPQNDGFLIARKSPESQLRLEGREKRQSYMKALQSAKRGVDAGYGEGAWNQFVSEDKLQALAAHGGLGLGAPSEAAKASLARLERSPRWRDFVASFARSQARADARYKRLAERQAGHRFARGGVAGDRRALALLRAYENLPTDGGRLGPPVPSLKTLGHAALGIVGVDPGVVRERWNAAIQGNLGGTFATLGPGGRPTRPGETVGSIAPGSGPLRGGLGSLLGREAQAYLEFWRIARPRITRRERAIQDTIHGQARSARMEADAAYSRDIQSRPESLTMRAALRSVSLNFPELAGKFKPHDLYRASSAFHEAFPLPEARSIRQRLKPGESPFQQRLHFENAEGATPASVPEQAEFFVDELLRIGRGQAPLEAPARREVNIAAQVKQRFRGLQTAEELAGQTKPAINLGLQRELRQLQRGDRFEFEGRLTRESPLRSDVSGLGAGVKPGIYEVIRLNDRMGYTTIAPVRGGITLKNLTHEARNSALVSKLIREAEETAPAGRAGKFFQQLISQELQPVRQTPAQLQDLLARRFAKGGAVQGFQTGGRVVGPTDTVPAMLTPGEVVISKPGVRAIESGSDIASRQRERQLAETRKQTDVLRRIERNQRIDQAEVAKVNAKLGRKSGVRRDARDKKAADDLAIAGLRT